MGLDLWFRDDVIRILTALASAGDQYGPDYQKALYDVALAFGVVLPTMNDYPRGRCWPLEHEPRIDPRQ